MDDLIHLLMNQGKESQASKCPGALKCYLGKYCMTSTPERTELTGTGQELGTSALVALAEPCAYLNYFFHLQNGGGCQPNPQLA